MTRITRSQYGQALEELKAKTGIEFTEYNAYGYTQIMDKDGHGYYSTYGNSLPQTYYQVKFFLDVFDRMAQKKKESITQ